MQHANKFLKLCQEAKDRITECTIDEMIKRKKDGENFLLIDVREENEFRKGAIPDSIHLGKGILERDIEQVAPSSDTCIILYCGGGYRSAIAAESLQKMGYSAVESMDGGFRGWVMSGHPIEIV